MNYKRRTFLRNVGVSMICTPIAANLTLGSNILESNKSSLTNSVLNKYQNDRCQLLYEEAFQLNENCRAIPMVKKNTFYGEEKSLLVIMDDESHFVLNGDQVNSYNDFIMNYKALSKDYTSSVSLTNSEKLQVANVTTPAEILESNDKNDFRFKNKNGEIVEVHSSKNKNWVRVLG
jgi:hypothetical protein